MPHMCRSGTRYHPLSIHIEHLFVSFSFHPTRHPRPSRSLLRYSTPETHCTPLMFPLLARSLPPAAHEPSSRARRTATPRAQRSQSKSRTRYFGSSGVCSSRSIPEISPRVALEPGVRPPASVPVPVPISTAHSTDSHFN